MRAAGQPKPYHNLYKYKAFITNATSFLFFFLASSPLITYLLSYYYTKKTYSKQGQQFMQPPFKPICITIPGIKTRHFNMLEPR